MPLPDVDVFLVSFPSVGIQARFFRAVYDLAFQVCRGRAKRRMTVRSGRSIMTFGFTPVVRTTMRSRFESAASRSPGMRQHDCWNATVPAYRTRRQEPGVVTRRAWLAGTLVAGWAIVARSDEAKTDVESTAEEIAAIEKQAKAVGLGAFRTTETEHFLGIGDSTDQHRADALAICQKLADVYRKSFRDKGFKVDYARRQMTVVTLKDKASYRKLLGEAPGSEVGGHFDLETNRLVVFDFRPDEGQPIANAERVNVFTLIHEGIHLLTFNTGLLDLKADVPRCISEGLATYGESWRPSNRQPFGLDNPFRVQALNDNPNLSDDWIAAEELFANDKLFDLEDKAQLAYAQSWVLAHYLLRTSTKVPKLRSYLEALRQRRNADERITDAETHFGNLAKLDKELKKHAGKAMRGG